MIMIKGTMKNTGGILVAGIFCVITQTGCRSQYSPLPPAAAVTSEKISLQEGDVVKVVFPDAPNLNTTAKVMRDGNVSLPVIGEFKVLGLTTSDLEKALVTQYADKIVSKEIHVSIEASAFQVYVTGSVMHPGKIQSERPLTALEAVLEAGGVDFSRANLKGVVVTRKLNGRTEHYKVDVQSMITGRSDTVFNLRPNDILFIPEKFSWY
ncbi:MAG: polysaccharide biosynthesis/export family protein [Verrucomicrobiota bacterium]